MSVCLPLPQLTLIELALLRAIDTHELVVYTWEPNVPENKPYRRNIDACIARFNKVSGARCTLSIHYSLGLWGEEGQGGVYEYWFGCK